MVTVSIRFRYVVLGSISRVRDMVLRSIRCWDIGWMGFETIMESDSYTRLLPNTVVRPYNKMFRFFHSRKGED